MTTVEASFPVRVARIGGRYLVFESEAAALLRRHVNTNGVLVGTAPQQPTQNIFLGLPMELRPEEVEALVRKEAVYVVEGAAAHRNTLQEAFRDPAKRRAYIDSLWRQKEAAQCAIAERNAQRAAEAAEKFKSKRQKAAEAELASDTVGEVEHLMPKHNAIPTIPSMPPPLPQIHSIAVTPTSSADLVPASISRHHRPDQRLHDEEAAPLCRHLLNSGYHMTPGLRFGAQYSVYPGDPLRFHAHFMASQYGWDEPIPILDIVAGGRLATAVKKAFLVGGEQPATDDSEARVRTFCLEWAAM